MPVWLIIITNTILPLLVVLNMIYDNKKSKKCIDISIAVVAWFTGDICYYVIQGSKTKTELVTLIIGNFAIYFVYWFANIIILNINSAKIEKNILPNQ